MKIEEIKILRGPNYWSVYRNKLIQMRLNLEEMEQRPTNKIEGFLKRLKELFPTMYKPPLQRRCRRWFFSKG